MKFEKASPEEIIVGGGPHGGDPARMLRDLAPFKAAIQTMEAGTIQLEGHDQPENVHKLLIKASHAAEVKIRSRWIIKDKTLGWKRVGVDARGFSDRREQAA